MLMPKSSDLLVLGIQDRPHGRSIGVSNVLWPWAAGAGNESMSGCLEASTPGGGTSGADGSSDAVAGGIHWNVIGTRATFATAGAGWA